MVGMNLFYENALCVCIYLYIYIYIYIYIYHILYISSIYTYIRIIITRKSSKHLHATYGYTDTYIYIYIHTHIYIYYFCYPVFNDTVVYYTYHFFVLVKREVELLLLHQYEMVSNLSDLYQIQHVCINSHTPIITK